MNPRNAILANTIVKAIMGAAVEVATREAANGQTSATRSLVEGTLQRIEDVLNTHNKTNFTDVGFLNELIGNRHGDCDPAKVLAQFNLMEEEFKELREEVHSYCAGIQSVQNGDYTVEEVFGLDGCKHVRARIRKELVDVHVTAYGLTYRMGGDADLDFATEWASQMSKFYNGDGVGAQVVADEITERTGLEVEVREMILGTFAFVSARDQVDVNGRHYPAGKQLKPHTFVPPQFIV